jgi:hypothetical protein
MIKPDMLDALSDEELSNVIGQAQALLKKRDADRKAKALADARELQAKAQDEARTLLESVGLSLQTLRGRAKGKTGRKPLYKEGCTYQHPTDKNLIWKANGQKPNWLRALEKQSKRAVAVQVPTRMDRPELKDQP